MCLSGIDDGEGCREYMCSQCQKEWENNRVDLIAARHERDAAVELAEQRGAAYGIVDSIYRQAEKERDLLVAEIQKWREGRAYIGAPMTYPDQRLIDAVQTIIGDARAAEVKL
jgi:hypothetical protein